MELLHLSYASKRKKEGPVSVTNSLMTVATASFPSDAKYSKGSSFSSLRNHLLLRIPTVHHHHKCSPCDPILNLFHTINSRVLGMCIAITITGFFDFVHIQYLENSMFQKLNLHLSLDGKVGST
jgi:hypothetical protein